MRGAGDKRRAWPGVVKGQYPQRSDRECLGTRQSLICLSPRLCQLESMRFEVMQITSNCQNSIVFNAWLSPCALWGLSFEWSHQRISSSDSKVRVTSQNSIKHSGSERDNTPQEKRGVNNPTTPQRATRTTSLTLKAVQERNLCLQCTLREVPSPSGHATLLWMKRCEDDKKIVVAEEEKLK